MQTAIPFPFGGGTVMIGPSFWPIIQQEMSKEYFIGLNAFLTNSMLNNVPVLPTLHDIFAWTLPCPLNGVKVVIIGQDPYFNPKYGAHGLAFSSLTKIPRSLRDIFIEIKFEYPGFKAPDHGYLMGWAQQGVLLLNRILTVTEGFAGSHRNKGWELFTNAVISYLNNNRVGLVFMLWGEEAKSIATFIDQNKHLVLQGSHPSPLSARHGFFSHYMFEGQVVRDPMIPQFFLECNQYLENQGKLPINWGDLLAP